MTAMQGSTGEKPSELWQSAPREALLLVFKLLPLKER
jgi:hypothetical protein